MLLPDTVGTGGDSHTRFSLAFHFLEAQALLTAAAIGSMPLNMPESVKLNLRENYYWNYS